MKEMLLEVLYKNILCQCLFLLFSRTAETIKKNRFKIWMTGKYENMLFMAEAWLT